jgi:hypothetical protein
MPEPMDVFERGLADRLRTYTDVAIHPIDHVAEARQVIDAGAKNRLHAMPIVPTAAVLSAVAMAAIVTLAAVTWLSPGNRSISDTADQLFSRTQRCDTTLVGDTHVSVTLPHDWWTNDGVADWPPCSWFAPHPLNVSTQPPEGVAIVLGSVGGPPMPFQGATSVISDEDLEIAGREARRVEIRVISVEEEDARELTYWISLGPSPESGPTLVARTSTDHAGDYELNKAILDRMMARLMID